MAAPKPGLWKILLAVGIGLALIAFVLGWIGFGVPDWQAFQRYNGSTQEYYGLWAYCQEPAPLYNAICKRWPDAEDQIFNGTRPSFVRTAEGLITTGMILLSLGIATAIFAAILPFLAYAAGAVTALGFLFLIIGVPIFGKQSNDLSVQRGDSTYNKRYGFWLMIPTIILSFLAAILFVVTGYIYQRFGFGNLATHSYSKRSYGGQRLLGPSNLLRGAPYAALPALYGMNPYPSIAAAQGPSLLSQYIARRMPKYYGLPVVSRPAVSVLPQPSIARPLSQPVYVTPTYYRPASVAQPSYAPVLNLTGRSLAGPVVRAL